MKDDKLLKMRNIIEALKRKSSLFDMWQFVMKFTDFSIPTR